MGSSCTLYNRATLREIKTATVQWFLLCAMRYANPLNQYAICRLSVLYCTVNDINDDGLCYVMYVVCTRPPPVLAPGPEVLTGRGRGAADENAVIH